MNQLATIKNKLQQLIKQYQILQKENVQLKNIVSHSNEVIQQQTQVIQDLQRKLELTQLQTNVLNKQDKVEIEKRINSYLKEIDNCLSAINKD